MYHLLCQFERNRDDYLTLRSYSFVAHNDEDDDLPLVRVSYSWKIHPIYIRVINWLDSWITIQQPMLSCINHMQSIPYYLLFHIIFIWRHQRKSLTHLQPQRHCEQYQLVQQSCLQAVKLLLGHTWQTWIVQRQWSLFWTLREYDQESQYQEQKHFVNEYPCDLSLFPIFLSFNGPSLLLSQCSTFNCDMSVEWWTYEVIVII